MPKINVYLPDELAEEVKLAAVPVSEVCQRALREEVLRVKVATAIGEDARLKAAAERLKALRKSEETGREADGHSAGMSWAFESAEYGELEAIARLADENWLRVDVDVESWPTLYGELEDLRMRGLHATDAFSQGFVKGARDAWWAMPDLEE